MMHHKIILDNGLSIIVTPMPYSHSVSVAIFTGTGSCHENPEEAGISHYIEHLCFKGTRHRPTSKDISQAIEGVGGMLNASTGKEATAFWGKVTSSHFPLLLDTLSDLILNPLLRQEDIEQERSVIIEEINMSLDSPQQRVNMVIDELLWPEQPLGRDIAGSKETVASINRDQITEYFSRRYLPSNTVVSIAGDIEPEEATGRVESLFNNWTAQQVPPNDYFLDKEQISARLQVNTRESEQAHLCLAIHGLPYTHPQLRPGYT
jgi:predicted Zn-dependent peptidase